MSEPTVRIEITLAQLMGLVTRASYDEEGELLTEETVADLVAQEIASRVTGHGDIWDTVKLSVRQRVNELVSAAIQSPPSSAGSLDAMIIAEAKAQLTPNPSTYPGTATPMAQYISALVYEAIRDPALQAVQRIQQEIDKAVARAVHDQLGRAVHQAGLNAAAYMTVREEDR